MKASRREPYLPTGQTVKLSYERPADPEIYFVDEILYQNIVRIHSEALQYFQGIIAEYMVLKLGTPANLGIIQRVSSRDFSEVKELVHQNIENNIANFKKAGIDNVQMLNTLCEDAGKPYLRFEVKADLIAMQIVRIRQTHPEVELIADNYSLDNGMVQFSDLDKTRIKKKYCTVYLNNPSKIEFVKAIEDVLRGIDKLKAILLRNNIKSIFGDRQVFQISESSTEQTIIFNKNILLKIDK